MDPVSKSLCSERVTISKDRSKSQPSIFITKTFKKQPFKNPKELKALNSYKLQENKNFKGRKVFVGGIKKAKVRKDSLIQYFSKFGELDENAIPESMDILLERGFFFIVYKHRSSADKALEEPIHNVEGVTLECRKAIPKKELKCSRKLPSTRQIGQHLITDGNKFCRDTSCYDESYVNTKFYFEFKLFGELDITEEFQIPITFLDLKVPDRKTQAETYI